MNGHYSKRDWFLCTDTALIIFIANTLVMAQCGALHNKDTIDNSASESLKPM